MPEETEGIDYVDHTHQEWFDIAWKRAKIQKRAQAVNPSTGRIACTYQRVSDEIPGCFIGCGMTQEVIDGIGRSYGNFIGAPDLYVSDVIRGFPSLEAAHGLQMIHDCHEPGDWEAALRLYAEGYNLNIPQEVTK